MYMYINMHLCICVLSLNERIALCFDNHVRVRAPLGSQAMTGGPDGDLGSCIIIISKSILLYKPSNADCVAPWTTVAHLLTRMHHSIGSNEILMSKEKIVSVIDGSGVLYDPNVSVRREVEGYD